MTPGGSRKISIYEHIRSNLDPELPDGDRMEGAIRWANGAEDGVLGHHGDSAKADPIADGIATAIEVALQDPAGWASLYAEIVANRALSIVDRLLARLVEVVQEKSLDPLRLRALARRLATQSSDREPVKIGIAILGLFQDQDDRELLSTLGSHDEFSLFAAVALLNTSEDPVDALWSLAKRVHGWGRIQVVERLPETGDPAVKDWLLREGYKNSVMHEYLAHTCAVRGDLARALEAEDIDDELLASAGEILSALIRGGPAADMSQYEDGAVATQSYVGVLRRRARTIREFLVGDTVRKYVEDAESCPWSAEKRSLILDGCLDILERPTWTRLVAENRTTDDDVLFWEVRSAARVLGIDLWDRFVARVRERPLEDVRWFHLVEGCSPERMARAVSLAEEHLPLDSIASGPAMLMAKGPEHRAIDFVLQWMDRVPGHGWSLIDAALSSPVVRNRNMAVKALATWGRERWNPRIEPRLLGALAIEPDEGVRRRIECVLDGRSLADDAK